MVSIRSVAERAGVSPATVSRVLNGNPTVNGELRRAVEQAIAELGYRPNVHAQQLRGKGSRMIGLIFTAVTNPFFADVAEATEDYARRHGYSVIIGNTHSDIELLEGYIRRFLSYGVEGLVVVPPAVTKRIRQLLNEINVPFVVLDQLTPGVKADQVGTNNRAGAYELTTHLLDLGYRRIGFIGGDPLAPTARDRLRGYRDAHVAQGVPVAEELVKTHDFFEQTGFRLTTELLSREQPDALFAVNLNVFMGTIAAVRAKGLAIPDAIAVVGFDDLPYAATILSTLTVVAQQSRTIGTVAAQLLFDKLLGSRSPSDYQTVLLQPELRVRESCGVRLRKDKLVSP